MGTLTQVSYTLDGKLHTYMRPSQARKIDLKATSNRGFLPSLKPHIEQELKKKLILDYESHLEHEFLLLLDHDPNCVDLQPQPIELKYITTSGKEEGFYPDCWAIFENGKEFLFEIKPEYRLKKLIEEENWNLKVEATQEFCKKRGWTYQIFTERKIHCARLDNIKDLVTAAKHFSFINMKKDVGMFNTRLQSILKDSPMGFSGLVRLLDLEFPNLEREEIISLLKHKIYFLDVSIDWNTPLESTIVFLDGKPPVPIYELPTTSSNDKDSESAVVLLESEENGALTEKRQKMFDRRLKMVTPIVNKFGKEGKLGGIMEFCKRKGIPAKRAKIAYEWYLKWKKYGEDGLMPVTAIKHDKSHLEPRSEELLREAIDEWNNCVGRDRISAHEDYKVKCTKEGVKPASYETFRQRIERLPASEQIGKGRPKTQVSIKRGLSGTYREGRHAGCLIQMDHTMADVWLVDSFAKQPLGRPWITLAIDIFSRSFWSLHISYDTPSQETVTQTILNGLASKEHSKDWKTLRASLLEMGEDTDKYKPHCSGFPARIQVDNGKDFNANSVREFLMDSNITLEFRPIKTPEYGGSVESAWDTINSYIRKHLLEGRVHPLPKTQKVVSRVQFKTPEGYDPKKDAAITLDEFREWLYGILAVRYSTKPKGKQKLSPNERWIHGLRGEKKLPMGGALRNLDTSEFQLYEFRSRIPHERTLSEKGLYHERVLYTSKWLLDARRRRILKDGERIKFKASKWDIRYIWMVDPETGRVKRLDAYNYDGDDAIKEHILRGLGKVKGFRSFRISSKDLKEANNRLGSSEYDEGKGDLIMDSLNEKLRKSVIISKKEQKHLEKLSKSKKDREKITMVKAIAQLDDEAATGKTEDLEELIAPKKVKFPDPSKLKELPTSFTEAVKDMELSFHEVREKKEEDSLRR